jgi:PTH2 family peptidyl-tRNA hydrolase
MNFEYKQVIVVREDLRMSPGKLAAQVAHGAVAAAEKTRRKKPEVFKAWLKEGQKKVVVRARNLEELRGLQRQAQSLDLVAELITDAGLTELPPGTVTVLGIGPDRNEIVDKVTGHLRLL